jgi:hypothetical protein
MTRGAITARPYPVWPYANTTPLYPANAERTIGCTWAYTSRWLDAGPKARSNSYTLTEFVGP